MWPKGLKINPEIERVVVGKDGKPFLYNIPLDVLQIKELMPDNPDDPEIWCRQAKAAELAMRGAYVDVCIDVWGWNVRWTISSRRASMYTWTTSALMPNVDCAPGCQAGNLRYDPNLYPIGCIVTPPPGCLVGE